MKNLKKKEKSQSNLCISLQNEKDELQKKVADFEKDNAKEGIRALNDRIEKLKKYKYDVVEENRNLKGLIESLTEEKKEVQNKIKSVQMTNGKLTKQVADFEKILILERKRLGVRRRSMRRKMQKFSKNYLRKARWLTRILRKKEGYLRQR